MEELENTNPTMDTPMDNPATPNTSEVNLQNSAAEQWNTDYSQLFSENIAENAPVQEEPVSSDSTDLQQNSEEPANVVEWTTPQAKINQQPEVVSQPEVQVQEPQVEAPEPNFQKELENTSLDNSQNIQAAQQAEAQQKARLEQQRLAQLKEHESKARKSWLISWILYGVILAFLALAAASIFAKDQVINAIDYLSSLVPTNNTNNQIIENTQLPENNLSDVEEEIIEEENEEEVDKIQQYYNRVDEVLDMEDDQESKTEQLTNILNEVIQENEKLNNLTQYISQKIMDLTINSEDEQIEENIENQENSEELDNPEENNGDSEENIEEVLEDTEVVENDKGYTITHVNSEQEANWVMPSHCNDLTCYGEDEEFVACTSFKMVETLDESTPRVSSRWWCKYKDTSELVYVKFSDTHNSAEDVPTDSSTATESEPILEEKGSTQE